MKKRRVLGLVCVLLLLSIFSIVAMRPAPELDLKVLNGRPPDRIEDEGRGGVNAIYRLEADLEQVATELEKQLGPPTRPMDMGDVEWIINTGRVRASRGKMFLSPEETADDNRRRLKAKMGSYEWLISQGYDKGVTIQVRRPPSRFSQVWFRLQDIFHL